MGLHELPFDLSAEIKSKFPISVSHGYLGRTAKIDKPEFTVLCLEAVLATKHTTKHRRTVRLLNVPPDELLCKLSPLRKISGSFPP